MRVAFDAAKFEGADDGIFFAVGGEGDKGIGDGDAAEIEGVGVAFGIGVKEGRWRCGRSHEEDWS